MSFIGGLARHLAAGKTKADLSYAIPPVAAYAIPPVAAYAIPPVAAWRLGNEVEARVFGTPVDKQYSPFARFAPPLTLSRWLLNKEHRLMTAGPLWARLVGDTVQPFADLIVSEATGIPYSEMLKHDKYRRQVNSIEAADETPVTETGGWPVFRNKAREEADRDIEAAKNRPKTRKNLERRRAEQAAAREAAASETGARARAITGGIVVGLLGLGAGAAYLDRRNVKRLQEQRREGSDAVLRSIHAVNELDRAERRAGAPAL